MIGGRPAIAAVTTGAVVVGTLALIGAPSTRRAPLPVATSSPAPSVVAAGGIALTSADITLPDDASSYPAGPHSGTVVANCTGCHSPGMVLTQPKLTADQWQTEVIKMREVYKASVPDAAVPDIVAYLSALPAQRSAVPAPPSPAG